MFNKSFEKKLILQSLIQKIKQDGKNKEYDCIEGISGGVDSTYVLYAYQNVVYSQKEEYKDHLFLPFTDKTNGFESYGGGRYIDLRIPATDSLLLDFNQSYNPYCAYTTGYNCPIPPKENALPIKIEVGILAPERH